MRSVLNSSMVLRWKMAENPHGKVPNTGSSLALQLSSAEILDMSLLEGPAIQE